MVELRAYIHVFTPLHTPNTQTSHPVIQGPWNFALGAAGTEVLGLCDKGEGLGSLNGEAG